MASITPRPNHPRRRQSPEKADAGKYFSSASHGMAYEQMCDHFAASPGTKAGPNTIIHIRVQRRRHLTASGQMTTNAHSEALPPVAFGVNVPMMAVCVSRSDPYRMFARRLLPPARLPVVFVSFVAVISPHPHMLPAWTRCVMFMDADRGTKFYDDLCMCRTEA